MEEDNLLVIHGGGPTAVMNASLWGVLEEAAAHGEIGRVYGAVGGTAGLLDQQLADLTGMPAGQRQLLPVTPGTVLGSSRTPLGPEEYEKIAHVLAQNNIRWVLCNGGNGTMDTCGKIYQACRRRGMELGVMGIPKTMDNDLAATDHAPGFGSAARYMAGSVAELSADLRSLPIHVVVLEAMGRNAGWVTAASALAADSGLPGPDLIYLPERDFEEERFLADVEKLIRSKGCGLVVASEGLHDAAGKPIVQPVFQTGRSVYFGDVSAHLAQLITRKLGYKSRAEKPGLLGRASIAWQSPLDREEAALAGKLAVKAALEGQSGKMVSFRRLSTDPYKMEPELVDIAQVMLHERKMPPEFINQAGNGVTAAFMDWCRPLLGGPLPRMSNWNP